MALLIRPLRVRLIRAASTDLNLVLSPSTRSFTTQGHIAKPVTPRHRLSPPLRLTMPPSTSASASLSTATAPSKASDHDSQPPVFQTVAEMRQWRLARMREGESVGFVPTMGALHAGHLDLVRHSLSENDRTLVSIFVNPAQFAPSEDFSSYPRTLPSDLEKLESLRSSLGAKAEGKGVSAIFAPTVPEMYPSPSPGETFTQHVERQKGAFVYVKGLEEEMEGKSRPGFFRGVATVVTKLFHVVQPDLAYFGQKDIQQAIILRRLVSDLLFSHPPGPSALRVIPTTRDPKDGLALSSRNAYLTPKARECATALWEALNVGRKAWEESAKAAVTADDDQERVQKVLSAARKALDLSAAEAKRKHNVDIEPLYISLNDPVSLEDLEKVKDSSKDGGEGVLGRKVELGRGAILSGAAMIWDGKGGRKTRLIDNLLLGFEL